MTDLPEGLKLERNSSSRRRMVYNWTAPDSLEEDFGSFALASASCEFIVRHDGAVEIDSDLSPVVPVDVLRFILAEADRLKGVADEASG